MPVVKQVALWMNVRKPHDHHVLVAIARRVQTHTDWSFSVESGLHGAASWQGDGLLADCDDPQVVRTVREHQIPIVAIGGGSDSQAMQVTHLQSNHTRIAELALEHLLERGFQNFAFYGTTLSGMNPWSQERANAFQEAVRQADFPCSSYFDSQPTLPQKKNTPRKLVHWLGAQETPLGIMACDDTHARQVARACRQIGLRVPEDVAVIGVDNDPITCEFSSPSLSSVILDVERLADEAVKRLARLMEGEAASDEVQLLDPLGIATRRSTEGIAIIDPLVQQAVRFIRSQLHEQLKVHDVMQNVSESRSSLDNRFKQSLGRTVHEEIDRLRINRAQELIDDTDLPLKLIARKAGYGTVQYMTTIFRNKLEKTPAELREIASRPTTD